MVSLTHLLIGLPDSACFEQLFELKPDQIAGVRSGANSHDGGDDTRLRP